MMAPVEGSVNGAVVHFDVDYTPDEGEEDDRLIPDVDTATGRGACERLDESQAPKDSFNIVYIIFFILGMCSLLPWNMFITANQYFSYKLRNTTSNYTATLDESTPLQMMFESYFAVAAMVPNILIMLLNLALQHRICLQVRVVVPLIGMMGLFIVTTILTRVNTDEWQTEFFIICICSIVLINAFGGVFQGSIFGVAGVLPKRYMQAIMSGQGMGGILPSLLSIISIAASHTEADSAFIYFLCAVACMAVTLFAFLVLPRMKYASFYLNRHSELTKSKRIEDLESTESFEKVKHHQRPPFFEIFWKIKIPALMILLIFAETIALFPGTISSIGAIDRSNKNWANDYFTPVMCFLTFNMMDFTGRSLSVIQWPTEKNMILLIILSVLRVGFFPLFALCNIHPTSRSFSVVFNNDAYPFVFNTLFGFSNGYLGSLVMIYGPKFVDLKHSETAGVMMALFLSGGLAIGSVISVVFVKII
ncbi:equilibrative nucleoside transporter 1-like isoform X2 [Asterias rubens]|uniref:equilibrative nucleoside transporter 1-like isoform X2 n=1 Tax=Asterias rubens TaxID=7604 RepID=UPI001454F1C1|nr:equilibrative nucleoside transporter 1-like isoform X2 [Asterias rubens]